MSKSTLLAAGVAAFFLASSALAQTKSSPKKQPTITTPIQKPMTKAPVKRPIVINTARRDADGDGNLSIAHGGSDCDDNDPRRYVGAVEVGDFNSHDEDCDSSTFGLLDRDGDGFTDSRVCNVVRGSQKNCGRDCDDSNASIHPGQIDIFNNRDDNCDGVKDEDQSREMLQRLLGR